MSDILPSSPDDLTPDLALWDPEAYKARALLEMGSRSAYGATMWNYATDHGVVDASRLSVDNSTWVSRSSAQGNITLGTAPMNGTMKERLLFHGDRFTYADEAAYRLLHEIGHGFLYLTQHSPVTERLRRATSGVREATGGEKGLSSLGSLSFYTGENKATEDATELITMFAWSPDYAREFTDFLADPRYADVREDVGLIALSDAGALYELISQAVTNNL